MINMEQIDRVIEITGASYAEVRQALLDHDGDVDQATLSLLRKHKGTEEPAEEKPPKNPKKTNTHRMRIPMPSRPPLSPRIFWKASKNCGKREMQAR